MTTFIAGPTGLSLLLGTGAATYTISISALTANCRTTLSLVLSPTDGDKLMTKEAKKDPHAIDKGIGQSETGIDEAAVPRPDQHERKHLSPTESKCRKHGTGGVYMINDHLFEGRFTPRLANGKRKAYNVYAHTRKECEEKQAEMIAEVKAKIAAEKAEKQ